MILCLGRVLWSEATRIVPKGAVMDESESDSWSEVSWKTLDGGEGTLSP